MINKIKTTAFAVASFFLMAHSPGSCSRDENGTKHSEDGSDINIPFDSTLENLQGENLSLDNEIEDIWPGYEMTADFFFDSNLEDYAGENQTLDEESDVAWPGCEITADFCLPSDTLIFYSACVIFDSEGNSISPTDRFSPACAGATCECGFIKYFATCDMGSCFSDPNTPSTSNPTYCATGKRILCVRDWADDLRPPMREGCCDEIGNVYCELDPIPGTNRCF
uniref:Uncharacterized protein n=1 Tax=candidate division WOR-3 bacterium TaxID=2052148 RepID=A0A7V3VTI3_UNCW3